MYLIQEDLARAHMCAVQEEAAAQRVVRGLLMVRKAARRADKAARKADSAQLHAKRALASAVAYD